MKIVKYVCLYLIFTLASNAARAQSRKSNIIVIVVDDMRFDEWGGGGHPFLKTPAIDKLVAEGTKFQRAYHAVPLCSPNRASILTGQYPSRHGISDNTSRNQESFMLDLFPKYLQNAGFKTAHVGKWHMGNSPMPRPGYDYWLSFEGQGTNYNPKLYEGESESQYKGYITDILTDKSIDFIKKSKDEPFFLYIGHKAVHPEARQRDDGSTDLNVPKVFIPADRHKGVYASAEFKRSPSFSARGIADANKPVIQNAFAIRDELMRQDSLWIPAIDLGTSDQSIRNRAEMMLAVDESLERIVNTLKDLKIDQETTIIFTSDNGYFFGEHGLSLERRLPYEESIKAPLFIKCPSVAKPQSEVYSLALSIDIAATALDLANVEIPKTIQGMSLLPLIKGEKTNVRKDALVEYYSNENPFPWTAQLDYRLVVNERYKYIKWLRTEESELYDLHADPYEQNNLVHQPKFRKVIGQLKKRLATLQIEALGLN